MAHIGKVCETLKQSYMQIFTFCLQSSQKINEKRIFAYFTGAAAVTYSQRKGRRHNTYDAFIKPILHRRTLTVEKYARVYKVSNSVFNARCMYFFKMTTMQRFRKKADS